jgi:sugar phosphate isomerase/epimerase
VHTHAKDGIRLREVDPRQIYGSLGYEPFTHQQLADAAETGGAFREVPLGEGNVNWSEYMKALVDIGYTGYLTIEREVGDNPEADIAKAVQFLKQFR